MKEIPAENYVFQEEEEEAHRLSFGDLAMLEESTLHSPTSDRTARSDILFEFSAASAHPAAAHSYFNDIVFCGKIIHENEEEEGDDDDDLNEYQKRDYFATVKSQSLRKPSPSSSPDHRRLSASTRHSGELARPKCSDLDYHAQRVNITSLTSMSAKSRRRMFMFGPVKFKPEMELSAIKQRQAKLPAVESGGGKGQWAIFKSSFRGRSHLTSVLARSLGCIPVAGAGMERRLGAAN